MSKLRLIAAAFVAICLSCFIAPALAMAEGPGVIFGGYEMPQGETSYLINDGNGGLTIGSEDSYNVKCEWNGDDSAALTLDGLQLTACPETVIDVINANGNYLDVILSGDNSISLSSSQDFFAAIRFNGSSGGSISGGGSLNLNLTNPYGTVYGINSQGSLSMNGANITMQVSGSNASYGVYASSGLWIGNSYLNITSLDGPYSYGIFIAEGGSGQIDSGSITATAGSGQYSVAIYANNSDLTINGGTVSGTSSDSTDGDHGVSYGIRADGTLNIAGGEVYGAAGNAVNSIGVSGRNAFYCSSGYITAQGSSTAFDASPDYSSYSYPSILVSGNYDGGNAVVWDGNSSLGSDGSYRYIKFAPSTPVSYVSITDVAEPLVGNTYEGFTPAASEGVGSVNAKLQSSTDGSEYTDMVVGDAYVEGNYYRVIADLTPAEGYLFYEGLSASINGIEAEVTLNQPNCSLLMSYGQLVAKTYSVSVDGGSASADSAKAGTSVTITAVPAPEGMHFFKWGATGISLSDGDAARAELTFTMPSSDVSFVSSYEDHKGGKATCVAKAKCEVCGAEYGKLGHHKWGKPEYKANIEKGTCEMTRVCEYDKSHVKNETAEISKKVAKKATCSEEGIMRYTATFKDESTWTKDEKIAKAPHALEKIEKEPATHKKAGHIAYYHCKVCDKLFSDAKGTKELDSRQVILPRLSDYTIKAKPDTWQHGSDKDMVFTASGDLKKFKELKIDDKVVDKSKYTAEQGSTIITLKPAYLSTLPAGCHTLTVVYNDDDVTTKFNVEIAAHEKKGAGSDSDSRPLVTGGSGTWKWIVVGIIVLAVAVAGITMFMAKRRPSAAHRRR